jgi:GNAT superfamily N-acetyltransferase
MQVRSASVQDVDATIYKQLYSLNRRDSGYMRPVLKQMRANSNPNLQNGTVHYIEENGKVLSWAITFHANHQNVIQIYTRRNHRGKGLGRTIVNHAKPLYDDLRGHNDTNMFRNMGMNSANVYYYSMGVQ